ncbi:bifunctional UDP-sugar hydrolase/5'-nucleotidase [Methanoculleus sp.]|uniref:bifunctional metallophosphatase/5'-nucleotidase n=1 Tax=Methanoculleus sp. TaxID=90427 RepID=UPI001BD50AE5|nr:5'-nucleotidase C-terminal domain-containing protein [Methanoculleus sp.]
MKKIAVICAIVVTISLIIAIPLVYRGAEAGADPLADGGTRGFEREAGTQEIAPSSVSPPGPSGAGTGSPVNISILAINDFHGHLFAGQQLNGRPAGSAPVLASYLKSAVNSTGDAYTILALTGDTVGASPAGSALLLDEPAMLFFNYFANAGCCEGENARCDPISVPGNHEFNRGTEELMRMIYGGNGTTAIPRFTDPYPGSNADNICANVVWKENGTPILPPYTIREVDGARIAFIGAVTIETPILELPQNVECVTFIDEAEAINRYVPELQEQGIHAIVILLHEGGTQEPYEGSTREGCNVTGPVTSIVAGLDPDVDVVLAAHKHGFTNAYLPNVGGKDVLVVQAYAYGVAYADVDLRIDPVSGEIIHKSAEIVPVYADQLPGTEPDPAVEAFLTDVEAAVSRLRAEVIAASAAEITRVPNAAGESALGNLVADSQRTAMNADVAFVTSGSLAGSLQADLARGNITWNDLEAVLPSDASMAAEYGGWYSRPHVASRPLSGDQILTILERQWETPVPEENLSISGLTYTYDPSLPAGGRVTEVLVNGTPLDPGATYTAAMNYYMAYGMGGNYSPAWDWDVTVTVGPADIDALADYIRTLPRPLDVTADGRVTRVG